MKTFDNQSTAMITGIAASPYEGTYSTLDGPCYRVSVAVKRLSGIDDVVPVVVPESCLENTIDPTGLRVAVKGSFLSRNRHAGGKHHLDLFLYADVFTFPAEGDTGEDDSDAKKAMVSSRVRRLDAAKRGDINSISLTGFITKPPVYRVTPRGSEVADIVIAVNGSDPRYPSYIPCVAWGKNARLADRLRSGDLIYIEGRIQSREYKKFLRLDAAGDPVMDHGVAYEVACSWIELLEKGKERRRAVIDYPAALEDGEAALVG